MQCEVPFGKKKEYKLHEKEVKFCDFTMWTGYDSHKNHPYAN